MASNGIFFSKAAIIGVGLIGGSVALALRENGLSSNIYGYGRNEDNLKKARELGIIDAYTTDISEACRDSEIIVLATPVGRLVEIAGQIKGVLRKNALVTDVGSVKGRLVYDLEASMPENAFYVGAHPIAGSDTSGINYSRHDLFQNALCIVTPTEKSDSEAVEKVVSIWNALGARVELMEPHKHDRIYAAVSHLPHIISYTAVNTIRALNEGYIGYAGQGFRDMTRIALSSPELWRDISIFNRDNLLEMINTFRDNLDRISCLLKEGNGPGLEEEFLKAQQLRMRLK